MAFAALLPVAGEALAAGGAEAGAGAAVAGAAEAGAGAAGAGIGARAASAGLRFGARAARMHAARSGQMPSHDSQQQRSLPRENMIGDYQNVTNPVQFGGGNWG